MGIDPDADHGPAAGNPKDGRRVARLPLQKAVIVTSRETLISRRGKHPTRILPGLQVSRVCEYPAGISSAISAPARRNCRSSRDQLKRAYSWTQLSRIQSKRRHFATLFPDTTCASRDCKARWEIGHSGPKRPEPEGREVSSTPQSSDVSRIGDRQDRPLGVATSSFAASWG